MKKFDFERGVAINPETPVDEIIDYVGDLDEVMIMAVVPGAGGQAFMQGVLGKARVLRSRFPDLEIGIDGGIDNRTIVLAKEAGVNRFAANSVIFSSPDPANSFEILKSKIES